MPELRRASSHAGPPRSVRAPAATPSDTVDDRHADAHAANIAARMALADTLGRPLAQPAALGHRPVQPALRLLHAGGATTSGCPARTSCTSRRSSRLVDVFLDARRRQGPPDGRRAAACAATCPSSCACSPRSRALRDLAMTTNGVLLAEAAAALKDAGLHRVTVSLDTLRPERFRRSDALRRLAHACSPASTPRRPPGFASLKIDTVVMRGVNDDELPDCSSAGRRWGAEVRFIEYMDVGGATHWSRERSSRAPRCWTRSPRTTARSRRSSRRAPRRPSASGSPTARSSASSPRRRRRSAAPATAAA